jgi:hypothetical protein
LTTWAEQTSDSLDRGTELVVPVSGELLSLEDTAGCVRILGEIRQLEQSLKEAKAALTEALRQEFERQGTKTLEIEGVKAELRGGSEIVWDVETLEQLRVLGLPAERMAALITTEVSYKVNARVAKQIAAANEEYAAVIESAKSVIPKASYVILGR